MTEVKVEKTSNTAAPKRYNRFQQKRATTQEPKFDRRCEDIKGFVFYCANGKHANRYNITIRETTAYFGITYDYGGDIMWLIKNEEKFVRMKPAGK
jgi:hypothetical protein